MFRKSGLLAAFILTAIITLFPAIARADCGLSQLKTEFFPKARELEAMPLTPEYVTPAWGLKDESLSFTTASSDIRTMGNVTSCPDDSLAVQGASQMIVSLWKGALEIRSFEADIHLVTIGESQVSEPPQCVNVYHKRAAMMIDVNWSFLTAPTAGNARVAAALKSMPEFAHILSLWQTLAASEGVHLSPLTSRTYPNGKLKLATDAAYAHLPAGVKCLQSTLF